MSLVMIDDMTMAMEFREMKLTKQINCEVCG
ncbi:hypothetical protein SVI_4225 [Shewanella violacea DSS12]|uniref:Uncharacterized protein n=1 Tax=Shewanella violacea (strain JCM 10179 / CIP 106290 / LMG 19151 / DSS12) TaxID=637905 RepID=D4ZF30_SHEVD|nr:hypothetical protein SVI_4223 [Shewanella violacea DSS12]BAJ04196.1 hypothetical protein SVI_4225 [Shewanella violacea DSS12]